MPTTRSISAGGLMQLPFGSYGYHVLSPSFRSFFQVTGRWGGALSCYLPFKYYHVHLLTTLAVFFLSFTKQVTRCLFTDSFTNSRISMARCIHRSKFSPQYSTFLCNTTYLVINTRSGKCAGLCTPTTRPLLVLYMQAVEHRNAIIHWLLSKYI